MEDSYAATRQAVLIDHWLSAWTRKLRRGTRHQSEIRLLHFPTRAHLILGWCSWSPSERILFRFKLLISLTFNKVINLERGCLTAASQHCLMWGRRHALASQIRGFETSMTVGFSRCELLSELWKALLRYKQDHPLYKSLSWSLVIRGTIVSTQLSCQPSSLLSVVAAGTAFWVRQSCGNSDLHDVSSNTPCHTLEGVLDLYYRRADHYNTPLTLK